MKKKFDETIILLKRIVILILFDIMALSCDSWVEGVDIILIVISVFIHLFGWVSYTFYKWVGTSEI